jgi:hypothetical protein
VLLRRLDEHPRWWTLLAVGAAGLVVGLVAVRATLSTPEARAGATAAPLPNPSPASRTEGASIAAADAETEPAADAGIEAMADAGTEAVADVADVIVREPGAARSSLTLRPGRVAYLRCDEPCPRDRDLERATWRALQSLSACAGIGAGAGDLRVTVGARSVTDLHLGPSDVAGDVVACVRPSLAGTPTSIDAQLVVSFRFELGSD